MMKHLIIGLFFILLAGAAYFSLERILFCDASFILFRIINYQNLQIQEHRYGSFITQAVPLLFSKLHLPLRSIVIAYSISFNLFYLVVAWILLYRLRLTGLALLMAFYFILFASDTYFWTNNEVHQGIAWMFLWIGLVWYLFENKHSKPMLCTLFIILGFLSVFTHPLVMFPAIFLWIFFLLNQKISTPPWLVIILTIILLLICYIRYRTSIHSSSFYDAEKLKVFKDVKPKDLLYTFTSPMAKQIYHRCVTNYWLIPILFLTGIFSAIRQKKYQMVLLTVGFCAVYFMAVCITFKDFIPFYTESEWMPFSIIATTPFVFYTLPQLKNQVGITVIAIIFLTRLTYIFHSSEKFTERKDYVFSILSEMNKQRLNKAVIPEVEINLKVFIMNWGVPTESILASALHNDHPQKNFVIMPLSDTASKIPADPNLLLVPFGTMHFSELNKRYFEMDTGSRYRVLRY